MEHCRRWDAQAQACQANCCNACGQTSRPAHCCTMARANGIPVNRSTLGADAVSGARWQAALAATPNCWRTRRVTTASGPMRQRFTTRLAQQLGIDTELRLPAYEDRCTTSLAGESATAESRPADEPASKDPAERRRVGRKLTGQGLDNPAATPCPCTGMKTDSWRSSAGIFVAVICFWCRVIHPWACGCHWIRYPGSHPRNANLSIRSSLFAPLADRWAISTARSRVATASSAGRGLPHPEIKRAGSRRDDGRRDA